MRLEKIPEIDLSANPFFLYTKGSDEEIHIDRIKEGYEEFKAVVFYLPHMEVNGDEIRIVRIKEGKEDIIKILNKCCPSHKSLVKDVSDGDFYAKRGLNANGYYRYDKESECYYPPGDIL